MAVKKLTEIPTVCPCLVREVSGEERLRFFDLGFFRGSRVLPMYECTGGGKARTDAALRQRIWETQKDDDPALALCLLAEAEG